MINKKTDTIVIRILHASILHFGKKHYKNVKVRDIAKSCKISSSLLYYHFKNKEQLLIESYSLLIESRTSVIKNITFKKLTLVLLSIFLENPMYANSINELLSKKPNISVEINDILKKQIHRCSDINIDTYTAYKVALVSLFAHPIIMRNLNEAVFDNQSLYDVYSNILK
uniref:HTH tetR-type domain-containing protein n=1 Tax=Aliivibrio wodanis TaxID=80852 RepID=A0A5Q4ZXB0_9GAMM|nr:hypothetical protein AW0309160_04213 [Aliivibrio wodanis]